MDQSSGVGGTGPAMATSAPPTETDAEQLARFGYPISQRHAVVGTVDSHWPVCLFGVCRPGQAFFWRGRVNRVACRSQFTNASASSL